MLTKLRNQSTGEWALKKEVKRTRNRRKTTCNTHRNTNNAQNCLLLVARIGRYPQAKQQKHKGRQKNDMRAGSSRRRSSNRANVAVGVAAEQGGGEEKCGRK